MSSEFSAFKVPKEKDFLKVIEDAEKKKEIKFEKEFNKAAGKSKSSNK